MNRTVSSTGYQMEEGKVVHSIDGLHRIANKNREGKGTLP